MDFFNIVLNHVRRFFLVLIVPKINHYIKSRTLSFIHKHPISTRYTTSIRQQIKVSLIYHCANSIDKASFSINSILLDFSEVSEMFISDDHDFSVFSGLNSTQMLSYFWWSKFWSMRSLAFNILGMSVITFTLFALLRVDLNYSKATKWSLSICHNLLSFESWNHISVNPLI